MHSSESLSPIFAIPDLSISLLYLPRQSAGCLFGSTSYPAKDCAIGFLIHLFQQGGKKTQTIINQVLGPFQSELFKIFLSPSRV